MDKWDFLLEESVREAEKEADKASKPSRVTQIALIVAVVSISAFSLIHGINEAWAWEVAKTLVTVDGLILGFAVLAGTSLTRRAVVSAAYKTMVEEAIDEFIERSPKSEETLKRVRDEKLVDRTLVPVITKSAFRIGRIAGNFQSAITLLLVSVGLSFCLFGVSDTLVQNPLFEILFFVVYYLAIAFLILGAYSVMSVSFTLVSLNTRSLAGDSFDIMWKILEKKAEEIEEEKKKGKEKKEG